MGAYQGLIDKEEKVVRLRERREKLRRQLEQERALLAVSHCGVRYVCMPVLQLLCGRWYIGGAVQCCFMSNHGIATSEFRERVSSAFMCACT